PADWVKRFIRCCCSPPCSSSAASTSSRTGSTRKPVRQRQRRPRDTFPMTELYFARPQVRCLTATPTACAPTPLALGLNNQTSQLRDRARYNDERHRVGDRRCVGWWRYWLLRVLLDRGSRLLRHDSSRWI